MAVRNPHSFHFPIQKFDDDVGLYKNFRYLEDYLQDLSIASSDGHEIIIAPSNSTSKRDADIVLTGVAATDEATMINLHGVDGIDHFRFLDGTITGSLLGNTETNRKQRSISVSGQGPGITIWDVPTARNAILSEDNQDPSTADELTTSITGISFNLAAVTTRVFSQPVWRVYMWDCEVYGSVGDSIGDGDTDSRGAVVWGNVFRDNGNGAGDDVLAAPRKWIIVGNYFHDNNVNSIRDPRDCIIANNHFRGSNTAIDFVSSSGNDNVITGNYFGTTTVFANLTAGNNIIGLNYPAATATVGILDNEAIHDNVASEISAITNKATPTGSDFLVIEDAAAANAKKHITITNLQAILDHGTIAGLADDDHSAYPAYTEWADWTPTLSNMTLGNGTVVARYTQIGKTVFARFSFILGSTSAISNNPGVTVPVTPSSTGYTTTIPFIGIADFLESGVARNHGVITLLSTTDFRPFVNTVTGTYATSSSISATVPFTWGTADEYVFQVCYEAATAV